MSEQQLAIQAADPVAAMLQKVIDNGVTSESVAALDKLADLYLKVQTKQAEKDFTTAFARLQSEMPTVEANKAVPNRDGTVRYHFAPFEEIMKVVRPLLKQHGFAVSFDSETDEKRIVAVCTLMHEGGHRQSNRFAVRIGSGPPGSTETQADGAAMTYAKRGALCQALNIVVCGMDNDANNEGAPLTPDQVASIKKAARAAKVDEVRFLAYAGAAQYESIAGEKYDMLMKMLAKKEKSSGEDVEHKW